MSLFGNNRGKGGGSAEHDETKSTIGVMFFQQKKGRVISNALQR